MEYLKDYVWMAPKDGGKPEQVPTEGDSISQKLWQNWAQVDPPAVEEKEEE